MWPSSTANEDQPGPIGFRHTSFGGADPQSVLNRTPVTISSRCGPRNPGQIASGRSTGFALATAFGADFGAAIASLGVSTFATAAGAAGGAGAAGSAMG